jgi:lysophospholipase L1-like esterase
MRTRFLLLPLAVLGLLGAAPRPITLFLVGDSTMAQKLASKRPETGWGEALQQYFDVDRVRVVNLARNGRSTVSFRAEGRWDALLEELKPGDYVLIQFGHNDEKADNPSVYADASTDYPRNLGRFVDEARARGAHPVLLTPVARRRFAAGGTVQDTHGAYPDAARAVARAESVPLLDMQRRSTAVLREYGEAGSRALFLHVDSAAHHPNYPHGVRDDTHFSSLGAEVMARQVVEAIRESVPELARLLDPGAAAAAQGSSR